MFRVPAGVKVCNFEVACEIRKLIIQLDSFFHAFGKGHFGYDKDHHKEDQC